MPAPTKQELVAERDECLRIIDGLSRPDSIFQGTKEEAVQGIADAKKKADELTKQIKMQKQAIHLICRREGVIGLRLVTKVSGDTWKSGCWDIKDVDAESLIGGWIYLHPTNKNSPSEMGGLITAIQACERPEEASHKTGIAVVFESRREGKDQKWRGKVLPMGWSGGLVDLSLPHEVVA